MIFFRVQITEDEIQQITGRDESAQPRGFIHGYIKEIPLKQSLTPGMETLLNAPLHAPQKRDKVSVK